MVLLISMEVHWIKMIKMLENGENPFTEEIIDEIIAMDPLDF